MISLVNAKEVISTSGKETILLVTDRKGSWPRERNDVPRPIQSESTSGGPDAELPRREATQSRDYTQFFGESIPKQD